MIEGREDLAAHKSDVALVEAAINGDADSFTELCRRYYPAMVAIAHSVLGDRHLAEDAAQQALAKTAVKLPQLKTESKFGQWLAAICRNAAKDLGRSRKALQCAENLSEIAAEANQSSSNEAVREALAKL